MEWVEALKDELEDEALDFSTPATILQGLFQNTIYPALLIDSQGRLGLPQQLIVKVGGSKAVSSLLSHPKVFLTLPVLLQKIILDLLIFVVARKPYNIVRLQYLDDLHTATSETCSLNRHLLKLLQECIATMDLSISKRVLLLLGYCGSIGISLHEFKKFLSYLRTPSEFSLSLLQSLQLMLQPDDGATKACPPSIFNFSGIGSGIFVKNIAFPFPKEYQVSFWFRLESVEEDFPSTDIRGSRAFNTDLNRSQHLFTWIGAGRKGLDVYIEKSQLLVAVSHTSKVEPIVMKVSGGLKKGVWYHFALRHSKPKMTFFSKDELEVYLDDELMITESIRFPNLGATQDVDISIGSNFDGQMGPIYLFNEAVPPAVIQSIARSDAGRSESGESTAADLSRNIFGSDRRPVAIASKLTTCFHPSRCSNGWCIDIHGGLHGMLGKRTFPWTFHNPRDVLSSIGGVICLLPLFPRLLIENENIEKYATDYDPNWGIGLGSCLADFNDEDEQLDTIYDRQAWSRINSWKEDFYGYGGISSLLTVVRNAIYNSKAFQEQLLVSGGIEMIESALQCVPQQLIMEEGEKCVFALIQLKEAAVYSEVLQLKIAKLLLSNTSLWASSGSYQFLNSLLSVVLGLIKAEPATSAAIVEFRNLLDTMGLFENLKEENIVRSRMNSIVSNSGTGTPSTARSVSISEPIRASSRYEEDTAAATVVATAVVVPPSAVASRSTSGGPPDLSLPPLPIASPRLHQPLSIGTADSAATPSTRFSTCNSPASRPSKAPRTSNPNQALIASLRKMKSFKLALSETLQDELEEEASSPSKPSTSDGMDEEEGLEGIQEEGEDEDHHDGTAAGHSHDHSEGGTAEAGNKSDVSKAKGGAAAVAAAVPSSFSSATTLSIAPPDSLSMGGDDMIDTFVSPYSSLEKKKLREYIGCIVAMLLKFNPNDLDIVHIVDFVASCKDAVVLVELIQVLMFLMDQRDSVVITSHLVTAYGGVEELVSYLLVYLVHQPNEDLRCAGIRLLAFVALNLDQLPSHILALSTRRNKRSMGKLPDGMTRLQSCGALALLCEVVSSHCPVSNIPTYRAMLDLLLSKHGQLSLSIHNYETPNALRSQAATMMTNPMVFNPDHMDDDDEDEDVVDTLVLPIFLELLPKFPLSIHDQIYGDLLSLVKHSAAIRSAFSACPSWHLSMFGMVLELLNDGEPPSAAFKAVHIDDLVDELQSKAPSGVTSMTTTSATATRSRSNTATSSATLPHRKGSSGGTGKLEIELLRRWQSNGPANNRHSANMALKYSSYVASPDLRKLSNIDMNFDVGMKIYSTLLVHALERRNGWRQLDQSISPSFESKNGYLIAQSILSHLMNDLTFNLKSRHKELQKLLKSNSTQEQQQAAYKFENLLSTMLTASQIALIDQNCVMSVIPYPDVCKKRVHDFFEMQQHIRPGMASPTDSIGSSSMGTPRSVDSERFHMLSVSEQRKFLDEVEELLQGSFQVDSASAPVSPSESSSPVSPPLSPLNGGGVGSGGSTTVSPFLDLSHTWFDMNVLAVSTRFSLPSHASGHHGAVAHATQFHAPVSSSSAASSSSSSAMAASFLDKPLEELLHPLERHHDEKCGKLILILQALRIFDTLFWPSPEADFQDTKLLLFSKEGAHSLKSPEANAKATTVYMTIHSAVFRMSLFALNNISPTNAISTMTLRRMRKAMACVDTLLPEATLALDWVGVSVVHVVLHVQRLAMVLDPIFTLVGITTHDFRVRTFGPWEDTNEHSDELTSEEYDALDMTMADEARLQLIEDYFNNTVGMNLLRNLRAAFRFLIDGWHVHGLRLTNMMEERCARSMSHLVETMKMDLHTAVAELVGGEGDGDEDDATATATSTMGGGGGSLPSSATKKRSPSTSSTSSSPLPSHRSVASRSVDGGASSAPPLSVSRDNSAEGPSSPPTTLRPRTFSSDPTDAGAASATTAAATTGQAPSLSMDSNATYDATRSISTASRTASTAAASRVAMAAAAAANSANTANTASPLTANMIEYLDNHFDGKSIVWMLKWLLHPFFAKNILRSVELIRALDKLDNVEAKAVAKFSIETRILKDQLEEHRDVAIKSVTEMAELKALSREVHDRVLERNRSKRHQLEAQNLLKTKNVAARWHDCIQRFEDDWSPWTAAVDGTSTTTGSGGEPTAPHAVSYYELSKHRDTKLRNMLLTKLPEAIDHRDHAYLESKMKDQFSYLATQNNGSGGETTAEQSTMATATATATTTTKVALPVKFTPLVFAGKGRGDANSTGGGNANGNGSGGGGGANWADLEDDADGDLEDTTHNGGSNANGSTNATSTTTKLMAGPLTAFTAGDLINPLGFFIAQEKRPTWTHMFAWANDERVLMIMDANQIQLDQVISGTVLLSNKCLYFHCKKRLGGLARAAKPFVDRKYHLDRLIEAYGRRYLLQNSAVELFFADSPELFLAFKTSKELQRFFRVLKNQAPPLLTTQLYLNPTKLFKASTYTELWRRRLISNFEYLMRLNILAGRSYNDITQYPVFPWIIADYTSPTLDLTNPATFRPLDKPIGALNPVRLKEFLERYRTFDDDQVPKFMYGSHYSSAGVVLHYMVRQEPFTTLAVNLQGGRFDCPDRIFFDIHRTWQGCNHSMSDVKELIPEWFCCPDIFVNSARLPLGELQEGGVVDDVILPPWAKNAFEFIRLNREALESDYVSEHLHEWIDLIFGYKQKGPAAIKANNVFYYLTYENAIDIEAIDDHLQKEAAKAQVTHFGQTPSQLLSKEHPKRLPRQECVLPLCYNAASVSNIQVFMPAGSQKQAGRHQFGAVIAMQCTGDRLVVVHETLQVCYYRWTAAFEEGYPFSLRPDKHRTLPSASLAYCETLLKKSLTMEGGTAAVGGGGGGGGGAAVEGGHGDAARRPSQTTATATATVKSPVPPQPPSSSLATRSDEDDRDATAPAAPSSPEAPSPVASSTSSSVSSLSPPPPSSSSARPTSLLGRLSSFRFGNGAAAAAAGNVATVATSADAGSGASDETATSSAAAGADETATSPPPPPPSTDDTAAAAASKNLRRTGSLYGAAIAAGQSISSTIRGTSSASASAAAGASNDSPSSNSGSGAGSGSALSSSLPRVSSRYFGKVVQPPPGTAANGALGLTSVHGGGIGGVGGGYGAHRHGHAMHASHAAIHRDGSVSAGTWTPLLALTHHQVAMAPFGQRMLTCGYWDHAVKLHAIDTMKEVSSVAGSHRGVITTLEVGADGQILISGGMDGCLRVWVVEKPSLAQALTPEPFYSDYSSLWDAASIGGNGSGGTLGAAAVGGGSVSGVSGNGSAVVATTASSLAQANAPLICLHAMPGHSSPITSVSYSADLDMVLSGDSEGLLCVHTVRQGQFVRAMKHMVGSNIDVVLAMTPGYLIAHSASTLTLSVTWVNGQVLQQIPVDDRIECMVCNKASLAAMASPIFVCGTQRGHIVFRDAATLEELHRLTALEHGGGIRSLSFSDDEQFLLIGCRDGSYAIATDAEARKRLQLLALQKTTLGG